MWATTASTRTAGVNVIRTPAGMFSRASAGPRSGHAARAALGESIGLWIGLTTVGYYIVCVIFPPIVFGQYFNELLQQCGMHTNVWTWLIGVGVLLLVTFMKP